MVMSNEQIKDIIIALIQAGKFHMSETNEGIAQEIAKFEKAYFDDIDK